MRKFLFIMVFVLIQIMIIPAMFSGNANESIVEESPIEMEIPTPPLFPVISMTEEEMDTVVRVVAAEARGEPELGIVATAQCIRDRSLLWDLTPYEVVTAKGQFAAPYTGMIDRELYNIVFSVFYEGRSAYEEPVTHFHAVTVNPYWTTSHPYLGTIGGQKYYSSY